MLICYLKAPPLEWCRDPFNIAEMNLKTLLGIFSTGAAAPKRLYVCKRSMDSAHGYVKQWPLE